MNAAEQTKLSVVIPVYNEAINIGPCLNALMLQTLPPNEIIVVDNNSKDDTVKIVRKYRSVKLLKEPRQGLSYARNKGLNAAMGDLLVRIDADTILPPNHLEKLVILADSHPSMAGFTGYGKSRYEFIPKISIPWSWAYFNFAHAYLGHPVLWGANMAVRKWHWQKLSPYLFNNDKLMHEDQDLSLALASVGGDILNSHKLTVSVQMKELLNYQKYRKYGIMLQAIKRIDKKSDRAVLPSRLPKANITERTLRWIGSLPFVYGFYLITLIYGLSNYLRSKF